MRIGRSRALQSAKYLEKKRKKKLVVVSLSICAFLLLLSIFVIILRASFLQISDIQVNGVDEINSENLIAQAGSIIDGEYIKVLPRSNIFFYPKDKIEKSLKDSNKYIESLDVELDGLDTLEITVTERQPSAVACEGFKGDDGGSGPCFFLDHDGYIYREASQFSEGVYVKYYTSASEKSLSTGDYIAETSIFRELQDFIRIVKDADITVIGILIGEGGSYELYIRNKDSSVAVVYFDDRVSFDKTASNLSAFLQNSEDKNFDYINLRFGNSIFYMEK